MVGFHDFFPVITKRGFLTRTEFEPLRSALARANAWIDEHGVDVVNIETVVLPNLHHPYEEGTEDPATHTDDDRDSDWHQFIRVWYRYGKPAAAPQD